MFYIDRKQNTTKTKNKRYTLVLFIKVIEMQLIFNLHENL